MDIEWKCSGAINFIGKLKFKVLEIDELHIGKRNNLLRHHNKDHSFCPYRANLVKFGKAGNTRLKLMSVAMGTLSIWILVDVGLLTD
jgi:hypothetical protein